MVPAENLLGTVGGGVKNMMRNLEIERLSLAAMSLGIARRCLEMMVRYAIERRTFGKPSPSTARSSATSASASPRPRRCAR